MRDSHSVATVLRHADIVVNAAALKQVPTCEYFPYEAVRTNIEGPENIIRAIQEHTLPIETVVGISTDKACKPVNVMGMTKAIQERVFIQANIAARARDLYAYVTATCWLRAARWSRCSLNRFGTEVP